MQKVKRKHILTLVFVSLILLLVGFGLDNRLQTSNYDVYDKRVPDTFEGFKIAQLSDLHCQLFGNGQRELLDGVEAGDPDIIVLTGDIIDARIQDFDSVATLFEGLVKIAPVYAVSGNHEDNTKQILHKMNALYEAYGVSFLDDSGVTIDKNDSTISIYGLGDRTEFTRSIVKADPDTYSILLFHRSNLFDKLTNYGYGLVLSGHGHGGLIRLPFVGGIVSPDAGFDFTQKYTGGLYTVGSTTLVSNRGMAGSHGVPRVFNRPEIVFVTLHHAK